MLKKCRQKMVVIYLIIKTLHIGWKTTHRFEIYYEEIS